MVYWEDEAAGREGTRVEYELAEGVGEMVEGMRETRAHIKNLE